MFSANLNLPDADDAAKELAVQTIIQKLRLEACQDTFVGTDLVRGVSGGEKKRTQIGMELITGPQLLLLDEPTSGLDSKTAQDVVDILRDLVQDGRSVIMAIHQPRYGIFKQFDSTTILSRGKVAYSGCTSEIIPYFEAYGCACEAFNNPADFVLDCLVDFEIQSPDTPIKMVLDWAKRNPGISDAQEDPKEAAQCAEAVQESRVSWCGQFYVLGLRQWRCLTRNPLTIILPIFANVVMSLIWGTLYFDISDSGLSGVQNRIGGLFFIVMNLVFGNLAMIPVFVEDRRQFIQERSLGYYHTSPYFVSKVLTDILPNRIFPTLLLGIIVYWMMGLRNDADAFGTFLCALVMVAISAGSAAYFCACITPLFVVANQLIGLIYVFGMLFSGLLIKTSTLPSWLKWAQWLSFYRYAQSILARNEFEGRSFECTDDEVLRGCFRSGDAVLAEYNWDDSYLLSFMMLGALAVGFFTGGLWALRRATSRA